MHPLLEQTLFTAQRLPFALQKSAFDVASNPELQSSLKDMHVFVGNALYFLVLLHICGALAHLAGKQSTSNDL